MKQTSEPIYTGSLFLESPKMQKPQTGEPGASEVDVKGDIVQAVSGDVDGRDNGVWAIRGTMIGTIDLLDRSTPNAPPTSHDPPGNVRGLSRLLWIVAHEAYWNPLTSIELYISVLGSAWGLFLLLPFQTFNAMGKLWTPIRTLFGAHVGLPWYDTGAEVVAGLTIGTFHLLHLFAVCHGRRGDAMRSLTIIVLMSLWFSLSVLFFAADYTVFSYVSSLLAFLTLILCAVVNYRKAGLR